MKLFYKNLHIFKFEEVIVRVEYKIWTFEQLPDDIIDTDFISLETGMLTPEDNSYTIYFSRNNKSIYYYPNTKTHV